MTAKKSSWQDQMLRKTNDTEWGAAGLFLPRNKVFISTQGKDRLTLFKAQGISVCARDCFVAHVIHKSVWHFLWKEESASPNGIFITERQRKTPPFFVQWHLLSMYLPCDVLWIKTLSVLAVVFFPKKVTNRRNIKQKWFHIFCSILWVCFHGVSLWINFCTREASLW